MANRQIQDKKHKVKREARQRRIYQILIIVFSIILILSMVLSLTTTF